MVPTFCFQTHSLQDLQHPAISSKVFIQRDYSSGTICKFQTKFPSELESRVCSDTMGVGLDGSVI